jgi:hypothetical protein
MRTDTVTTKFYLTSPCIVDDHYSSTGLIRNVKCELLFTEYRACSLVRYSCMADPMSFLDFPSAGRVREGVPSPRCRSQLTKSTGPALLGVYSSEASAKLLIQVNLVWIAGSAICWLVLFYGHVKCADKARQLALVLSANRRHSPTVEISSSFIQLILLQHHCLESVASLLKIPSDYGPS